MVDESALLVISAIERACSVPSVLGSLFIIVTFCLSSSFRKPINRMLFYASFGNMLSNAATLMSRSYLHQPNSAGCQTQAFLIQTFTFADVFWALAMATNVYLTFYRQFDVTRLRKIEPLYVVVCYGVPFIPALAFIFAKNQHGVRAYGDAELWCWITVEWGAWRLATYGLIWLTNLITFSIYIRTGCTIYKWRRHLLGFTSSTDMDPSSQPTQNREPTGPAKTTEVTITTSDIRPSDPDRVFGVEDILGAAYAVNVSTDPTTSVSHATTSASAAEQGRIKPQRPERRGQSQSDKSVLSYTRCALLFFAALLITWIPSSANRLYFLIHDKSSLPLGYMTALVLPLQGFWNALIYFSTSRAACKDFFASLRARRRRPNLSEFAGSVDVVGRNTGQGHQLDQMRTSTKPGRYGDTESTISLTPWTQGESSDFRTCA
ncbi:hypothetical protein EDB81DRAFT_248244 [Dactylonectria macrodidyma]|uniref:G-protein coupled receptors family 2 profile 2 domain-containing protein n=1 Tax=Dactylonectria macrodidyma TaxID=307937 RepID=A0A9P9ID47_9HYPO|nr:hypothetical protein EDB81DRAFT_248244 [Dactylonectria macrodidyma]